MKKYKLFIFDLDGVIFNTKSNMRESWKFTKKKYNLTIPFSSYFSLIGAPFKIILQKLGIKNNLNEITQTYSEISLKKYNMVKIYQDVKNVLKKLSKVSKVAVVTSKDKKRTKIFIKKFGLKFDAISCPQKGLKGKPKPDQILKIIKKLSFKKKDCVYIGDMFVDLLTARNAKIDFILANYGYETKSVMKVIKINKFKDLIKYKTSQNSKDINQI